MAELIKNALQASVEANQERPPPVAVHIEQGPESTTFTVKDQAGGIREVKLCHLFPPAVFDFL